MKSFLTILFCSFIFIVNAQAPKEISYQGVARGASGAVLASQPIGVEFKIHQGSATGTVVFSETHSTSTNSFGLFNLAIGSANPSGFNTIDWTQSPYFIEVSIDPTGGTSYISVGTSPLISVPYALYAEKAGNATPVPTISINSPNTVSNPTTGVYNISVPSPSLDLVGNSLSITNGNTVTLPASPAYTAGSGIDLTGNVITNTAPAVTPTLTVSGNNISINPGNAQTLPTYSLTQSGGNIDLTQNGTSIATVSLSASTSTSLTAGNANIALIQTGNDYTITAVTPTLSVINGTLTGAYPSQTLTIPAGVTYVGDGTNIDVTGNVISLINTSVPPGTYGQAPYTVPTYSVDMYGRMISAGNFTPSINGDVNGTIAASTVVGLLGRPLAGGVPTPNQVLTWDGTSWIPANGPATPSITGIGVATVTASAPNYTVNVPMSTYNNSTGIFATGSQTISVAPALSLSGTTLTAGPTTNSVNLSSLPSNWTVASGVIYPTTLTNSVGIGTSGPLTDKMEINHASSPTNTHLHLKQIGGDAFSRIKFSNAIAPTKYWLNTATSAATDNNSGFNVFYHNGTVGRNMFTVAGDGKVSVNPFSLAYPTLFEVNGNIELDSTQAFNGLNAVPPVSLINSGRIYFDRTSQKFKISENGGAWVNLIGTPSPWAYNPGVIYPINNALNDKVAIGSVFANALLDVQAQAGSTITANPLVNIENSNASLNTSGLLRVSNNNGGAALIYAVNSHSTGDGLSLNMNNTSNGSNAIQVNHQGIGNAGYFDINNTGSNSSAIVASSNANGPVINATQDGNGNAGKFRITNTGNGTTAMSVITNGTGDAIEGFQQGTSGRAGVFVTFNGSNGSPTLHSLTVGNGHAGMFEVTKSTSIAHGVAAFNYGTGSSVYGNNQGTGSAGIFEIPGAGGSANPASALIATTYGTGNAGAFSIGNPTSGATVLQAETNGNGQAGNFSINNSSNGSSALRGATNGSGAVLVADQYGTGRAADFRIYSGTNNQPVIFSQTGGLGTAGYFETFNPSNTNNAITAVTGGTGHSIFANHMGTAGHAGYFNTPGGSTNTSSTLFSQNITSGDAIEALAATGKAISATNASNTNAAIYATNSGTSDGIQSFVGTGKAIYAQNNSSTNAAANISNSGGDAIQAISTGQRALYASSNANSYSTIETINTGNGNVISASKGAGSTGGVVGSFSNSSSSNPADAVVVVNNGAGAAVHAISGPSFGGSTNAALWLENGHIKTTSSNAPTIGGGGTNITGPTITRNLAAGVNSNDVSGSVSVNFAPSTNINTGQYVEFRVTFQKPYSIKPKVIAICQTYPFLVFVSGTSTIDCQIVIQNVGPVVNNVSSITVNYMIME